MEMEIPFTKEELNAMSAEEILKLPPKCTRLYPYCLIGHHINDVKCRLKEWYGTRYQIVLFTSQDTDTACLMRFNTLYFCCKTDANHIMTDIDRMEWG